MDTTCDGLLNRRVRPPSPAVVRVTDRTPPQAAAVRHRRPARVRCRLRRGRRAVVPCRAREGACGAWYRNPAGAGRAVPQKSGRNGRRKISRLYAMISRNYRSPFPCGGVVCTANSGMGSKLPTPHLRKLRTYCVSPELSLPLPQRERVPLLFDHVMNDPPYHDQETARCLGQDENKRIAECRNQRRYFAGWIAAAAPRAEPDTGTLTLIHRPDLAAGNPCLIWADASATWRSCLSGAQGRCLHPSAWCCVRAKIVTRRLSNTRRSLVLHKAGRQRHGSDRKDFLRHAHALEFTVT